MSSGNATSAACVVRLRLRLSDSCVYKGMASNASVRSLLQCGNLQVSRPAAFDGILLCRGTGVTHVYPHHWHEELHLCAYTGGVGYLRCRGVSSLVTKGSFVITPPGEVHENWVD